MESRYVNFVRIVVYFIYCMGFCDCCMNMKVKIFVKIGMIVGVIEVVFVVDVSFSLSVMSRIKGMF